MINRIWRKRSRSIVAFALVLSLLPLLTSAGTAPGVSQAQGQPADRVVSAQDHGRQIHLAADQVLAVRLEANPSTGYLWEVAEVDAQVLQQVEPMAFEPDSDLLGAPGIVTLRFRPAAAGETTLALVYHRPWEKEEALSEFSLQVTTAGTSAVLNASRRPPSAPLAPRPGQAPAGPEPQVLTATPPAFSWCDEGGCTPVKNQGSCGSCWAFGTVGVLESWIQLDDMVTRDLSEQYLVSCNTDGWGCGGGWWAHDYHLNKVPPGEPDAGAVYEADFPYVAADAPCNPPHVHHEKIASWDYVNAYVYIPSPTELKQAIYDLGPVAVAICAGPALSGYTGGVFSTNEAYYCGGNYVNHGVILVGWDDGLGAWRMRNSWGSGWGESGYAYVAYGTSNIGYGASYIVYEGAGPPPPPANLRVAKDVTPTVQVPGGPLTYTLGFGNIGQGDAMGVTVSDTLPAEVEYVSSNPAGTYDPVAHEVSWTVDLPAGGAVEATILVLVDEAAVPGTWLTNTAYLSWEETELMAEAATLVEEPVPSLGISKEAAPTVQYAGEPVTYTLVLVNDGDADAMGVVISDVLPVGVEYVSSDPEGIYDAVAHEVSWTVDLAVDQVVTATIVVTIDAGVEGGTWLTNTAHLSWEETERMAEVAHYVESPPAPHFYIYLPIVVRNY